MSLSTIAQPHAAASIADRENPSRQLGSTNTSKALYSAAMSSRSPNVVLPVAHGLWLRP
jgi:hypothetical protein